MAKRRLNGEGSIVKRADGRWVGAYTDPVTRKRGYVYAKNPKEVKAKIKERIEHAIDQKESKERMTLAKWMREYLVTYKQNELKPTTYSSYLYLFSLYIEKSELAEMDVLKVTTNDIQIFYNSKVTEGYSSKTIRHMETLINGALEMAVKTGLINDNPNKHTVLPKKEKFEGKTLTREEASRLIREGKGEWIYPLVIVCMTCGLRKGEALALKWENVDFKNRTLSITGSLCRIYKEPDEKGKRACYYEILEPKTKTSIRTVPLMDVSYEALLLQRERQNHDKVEYQEIYQDDGFVFARVDGRYLNPREIYQYYNKFLDKYHVPRIRFHDLRHTYASIMLESGISVKVLQELLGHSTISTTLDIYTHVNNKLKEEAVRKAESVFVSEG